MTGDPSTAIRSIVASSLDWDQAHATFDAAVANLPKDLRGKRPDNFPHSVWELVEHIRIAQDDLADFMERADYHRIKWPDDYWPKDPAPPDAKAWDASIAAFMRDREQMKQIARDTKDLYSSVPTGDEKQTYVRALLLLADHNAYHVGQLVAVRRALGIWK